MSDGYVGSVPMAGQVGDLETACAVSLTVSCCLRQTRIASGAIRFFHMSRTALAAVSADRETTGANALRLMGNVLR
ncbi:hypothetical protein [Gimesia algae]|uniref:hypothetical protein n=1 Tax=Gimesia algae TaxID=2527971 RepID=UPI0018D868DF|nr:hypothetical protein [Gimesia algae]